MQLKRSLSGGKEQGQLPGRPERPTGRAQAPWKPPATPARPVLVLWITVRII